MTERSMLQEKLKLQVAEEQLQVDLQNARAQARKKCSQKWKKNRN